MPKRTKLHPAQLIVISFAVVITLGTLLLLLPGATRAGVNLSFIDALFTAVSATCVTGLTTVDTGTTFTTFGQLVILACIQIGGLGLMTFTTIFLVLAGQRLGITGRLAVEQSFHHTPTGQIASLIRHIVFATLVIEGVGAFALTLYWSASGRFTSFGETLYQAVFHAVSAFCNAGFSPFSDSLIGFQRDPVVLGILSTLILLGGLGFLVELDLRIYLQSLFVRRFFPSSADGKRQRLSLHTKVVVITTGLLLAIGTISFYLLERRGAFAHLGEGAAWMNAWFCAVTPRTAGFNTIPYAALGGAALLCTMVLMFIGASPGSTGGGIKTSSFGLLVAYSIARWRGLQRLHLFHRTVPQESIDRAAGVVVAAVALVIVAASALMVTETWGMAPGESQRRLLPVIFETISAFATVGLSIDLTPTLTGPGKLIVAAVMFMGRIGPFTLAMAVSTAPPRAAGQYRYAEENVMIS